MSLETIVAQATPAGRGGVSILRLSGSRVKEIAEILLGKVPAAGQVRVAAFNDKNGHLIDRGLALFFRGPHSFTGEDVLELHGHGSPILVDLLTRRVLELGARLARPGEFSERAFLNGKLDLAQAEAIADLINASTEQAARSALRSLEGEFSKKIAALTEALIQLRIHIEAAIDFAEEEIDFLSDNSLKQGFSELQHAFENLRKSAKQGSLLRDGITVVIAGEPNVGKSTLLNALSGKELAIVTALPGTTRDILREPIQIDGLALQVIDTAGLRDTADPIEQEGIRRAQQEIKQADLLLYVVDHETTPVRQGAAAVPTLIVRNKIDLANENPTIVQQDDRTIVSLSAKKNQGLELLKTAIKNCIGFSAEQEGTFSARQRHLAALERAQLFLTKAQQQLLENHAGELVAEDLRQAQKALSEITGEFTTEDLLGRIFASFCIGK